MTKKTLGEELSEYIESLSDELLDVIEYYEYSHNIDEASKRKLIRVMHGLEPIQRFVRHAQYEEDIEGNEGETG